MIERMVPALYVHDLNRSKAFYCDLLNNKQDSQLKKKIFEL